MRMTLESSLQLAFDLVIEDVRQGATWSRSEALYQLWQTTSVDGIRDDGDQLSAAYRVVRRELERQPFRAELLSLVERLSGEDSIELDDLQEYWCYRAARGELS